VLTIPVLSADLAGSRRTTSHGLFRRGTSRSGYEGKKCFFQEKEVENVDIQTSCAALTALVGPARPLMGGMVFPIRAAKAMWTGRVSPR